MIQTNTHTITELIEISKSFPLPSGNDLMVLEHVSLAIPPGEIVAILGPSGCGKSTLLRILTGLLDADRGSVLVAGAQLSGVNPAVSMVFQQFALFPWMTVFDNIAVGLAAKKLSENELRDRVNRSIDLIGLEGFEEAYPKELSGGMKQRVGIARAIVGEPELLCMDEPFSALDVLTVESLRAEVVNLWLDHKTPIRSLLVVSHDIREAVYLASRIVIMSTNPGRIRTIIDNTLPYPRNYKSLEFEAMVDHIHDIITRDVLPDEVFEVPSVPIRTTPRLEPLPQAQVGEIIGLLEVLDARDGSLDIFDIAEETSKGFGVLIAIVKAAEMLDFVDTPKQLVVFTPLGKKFVESDVNERKLMLNHQLRTLRVFDIIISMLHKDEEVTISKETVLEEFAILLPHEDPEKIFETLVDWGRYAELFGYNADEETLYLDVGQEAV